MLYLYRFSKLFPELGDGGNSNFSEFPEFISPDAYRTERNIMYLLHRRRDYNRLHKFGRIKRRRGRVFGDDRYTGKIKRAERNV